MKPEGKPKLIPSVMATSIEGLLRDAGTVAHLSDLIHYDVADGEFVQTQTPLPADYPKLAVGKQVFWHLMVQHPLQYLDDCLMVPSAMVALHAEAQGIGEALAYLSAKEVSAGITLNPTTRVQEAAHLIDHIQFVQVMTVEPGAQGRSFQPEVLPKIDQLRRLRADLVIVTDGGANHATIESITKYQPDYIVVGSTLTRSDEPDDAWRTLRRLVALAGGTDDHD